MWPWVSHCAPVSPTIKWRVRRAVSGVPSSLHGILQLKPPFFQIRSFLSPTPENKTNQTEGTWHHMHGPRMVAPYPCPWSTQELHWLSSPFAAGEKKKKVVREVGGGNNRGQEWVPEGAVFPALGTAGPRDRPPNRVVCSFASPFLKLCLLPLFHFSVFILVIAACQVIAPNPDSRNRSVNIFTIQSLPQQWPLAPSLMQPTLLLKKQMKKWMDGRGRA